MRRGRSGRIRLTRIASSEGATEDGSLTGGGTHTRSYEASRVGCAVIDPRGSCGGSGCLVGNLSVVRGGLWPRCSTGATDRSTRRPWRRGVRPRASMCSTWASAAAWGWGCCWLVPPSRWSGSSTRRTSRGRFATDVGAGRLELCSGDAAALPRPVDAVDAVLTVNAMFFWRDEQAGLREVRRVLRPGCRQAACVETGTWDTPLPPPRRPPVPGRCAGRRAAHRRVRGVAVRPQGPPRCARGGAGRVRRATRS